MNLIKKAAIGVFCFCMAFGNGQDAPKHRARLYPPDNYERVDMAGLHFENAGDRDRLLALHAMISSKTDHADWMYKPLSIAGNFITEYWTKGPHNEWVTNGIGTSFSDAPGTSWYELGTLHYRLPNVFGLQVSGGTNPQTDGWGAGFYYAVRGKSILGTSCSVYFRKWDNGKVSEQIWLVEYFYPMESGYVWQEKSDSVLTNISLPRQTGMDEELALVVKSSTSMRDTAILRYDALLARIESGIARHAAKKKVYGEYKGDGIPPDFKIVSLSAREEREFLDKAQKNIASWKKVLEEEHETLHRALIQLAPLNRIWK